MILRPFQFDIGDGDPAGGAGGSGGTADPAPVTGPTPETQALQAELTAAKAQLANHSAAVQAARNVDTQLTRMAKDSPEAYALVERAMRGEKVSLPTGQPGNEGPNLDDMDPAVAAVLAAQQEEITQLRAEAKGAQAAAASVKDKQVEQQFRNDLQEMREELGSETVDELLPRAQAMVDSTPGLAASPGAIKIILKALDHENVGSRALKDKQAAEDTRQEKLLARRGLGGRGLGLESKPGKDPKRSPVEILRSNIDAVMNGEK